MHIAGIFLAHFLSHILHRNVFNAGAPKKNMGFGLNSKNPYKGKIHALEVKLGLFWDHVWTFVVIFTKMKEKTCKKGKKRCHNISHVKKYI